MKRSYFADCIHRVKINSLSKNIINLKYSARIIAFVAISYSIPGNALQNKLQLSVGNAHGNHATHNLSALTISKGTFSLNTSTMPSLYLSEATLDSSVCDHSKKQAFDKNRKPVAMADAVDLDRSANAFNVLSNDADPDGDSLVLIDALAKFGAVAFTSQGLIGYAQKPGRPRADIITYTITDGKGGFADGIVEITVR